LARFTQLGVVPCSWLSLASELQRSYGNVETLPAFREIQSNSPAYAMLNATLANASAVAAPSRQQHAVRLRPPSFGVAFSDQVA
jgi:hypothetical protein